ncbi:hypothetical protein E2K80_09305 [Rhodophyticola sp. CCM32]|uniref:hypothetical protein n=1 Tax=Rhodophyticola sp. CCM32 TaxID=2916397 RepID=UPI00107FD344|nr:hypothetical protein [Rhodophyticola sp. CCM32]QBY00898.1 hypothetical protein E2K80_09305 [Rhodophyticola sp. CCM32]
MARRVFLERRTYRRNRLQDAAKLLPVLGMFLFFGPVFILTGDSGEGGATAGWLVYFLGVWLALIIVTAMLAAALERNTPRDPDLPGGR